MAAPFVRVAGLGVLLEAQDLDTLFHAVVLDKRLALELFTLHVVDHRVLELLTGRVESLRVPALVLPRPRERLVHPFDAFDFELLRDFGDVLCDLLGLDLLLSTTRA